MSEHLLRRAAHLGDISAISRRSLGHLSAISRYLGHLSAISRSLGHLSAGPPRRCPPLRPRRPHGVAARRRDADCEAGEQAAGGLRGAARSSSSSHPKEGLSTTRPGHVPQVRLLFQPAEEGPGGAGPRAEGGGCSLGAASVQSRCNLETRRQADDRGRGARRRRRVLRVPSRDCAEIAPTDCAEIAPRLRRDCAGIVPGLRRDCVEIAPRLRRGEMRAAGATAGPPTARLQKKKRGVGHLFCVCLGTTAGPPTAHL